MATILSFKQFNNFKGDWVCPREQSPPQAPRLSNIMPSIKCLVRECLVHEWLDKIMPIFINAW